MGGWEAAFCFSGTFRSFLSRAGWRRTFGLNNPAPTKSVPASSLDAGIASRENGVGTFGRSPPGSEPAPSRRTGNHGLRPTTFICPVGPCSSGRMAPSVFSPSLGKFRRPWWSRH